MRKKGIKERQNKSRENYIYIYVCVCLCVFVFVIRCSLMTAILHLSPILVCLSLSSTPMCYLMRMAEKRWKRDGKRLAFDSQGSPLLEFVGIKRKDNGEWAIPGVS